jgi:hypothetical protein
MSSAAASCTILSYVAQFRAGYAPGFVASKPPGRRREPELGAIELHVTKTRTRVTPSERNVASVHAGFAFSCTSSWKIAS